MLVAAGIDSVGRLRALGPVDAFLAVKATGLNPSLNLLYALAGALTGRHWARLEDGERVSLLMAYDAAHARTSR